MELQNAAVSHHVSDLRRLANELRMRRSRGNPPKGPGRLTRVRIAIGKRLVALGDTLLAGTGARAVATPR